MQVSTSSYQTLGLAVIKDNKLDILGEMVPQLMLLKDAKQTSHEDRANLISILLFYSLEKYKKNIFIEALRGEDIKTLLENDKVKLNITTGLQFFTGKDIDTIRQQVEVATANDSHSAFTNAAPSQ